MNAFLLFMTLVVFGGVLFLSPGQGPGALVVCAAVSIPSIILIIRGGEERTFLLRLFVLGLLLRMIVATIIQQAHLQEFFGGDANTYDIFGASLAASWHGDAYHTMVYEKFVSSGAGAWGMLYLVAVVYELIGKNMLAIQFINASAGAATAGVIYYTSQQLFNNKRVSVVAAVMACFFPSLVLWSSQALKDGLIVLALAVSILVTLRLMARVRVIDVIVLTMCLVTLLSLRFYIFYMMVAAVIGAFVIGAKSISAQAFFTRFAAIALMGLFFTWFGVMRYANTQFERYGNLQSVQRSRLDAAVSAESGFAKDVDVRTTQGAITAIPVGVVYLLFAPFPWQLSSLRQSIALPEMVIWWLAFPLLVVGLWYAAKHRLRQVSPILLFTTMLTLAYSLFQGNVGTAYRQRSQLLVFYFIFVAVGVILLKERAEDRQQQGKLAQQRQLDLMAERARERAKFAAEQSTTAPADSYYAGKTKVG